MRKWANFSLVFHHERVWRTVEEEMQMAAQNDSTGASSDLVTHWHSIGWEKCHREVRRLQARIVKATQEGRHGRVKALQWLLTHSFSGKALAVNE